MSDFHPGYILNAIIYAVLGIIIFSIAFILIDKTDAVRSMEGDLREPQYSARNHGRRNVHRGVYHYRCRGALELAGRTVPFRLSDRGLRPHL